MLVLGSLLKFIHVRITYLTQFMCSLFLCSMTCYVGVLAYTVTSFPVYLIT